jgi:hypothetical protein
MIKKKEKEIMIIILLIMIIIMTMIMIIILRKKGFLKDLMIIMKTMNMLVENQDMIFM